MCCTTQIQLTLLRTVAPKEGTASMQVAWRHCAHLHAVQRVSLLAVQTARQSAVLSERASEMAQALVGDMPWAWGSWTAWAWEV